MTQPNLFQRLIQRLASVALISRMLSLFFHLLDKPVLNLTKGRASIGSLAIGLPIVTLTTTGARSGQPRSVPLVALPDGDRLILIASNWGQTHHPAWYHNLVAHPPAQVLHNGQTRNYSARVAAGSEYEACWQKAVGAYPGYNAYKARTGGRVIPIMVLTPSQS
jgi:deazaflavin-dependent oxidoreductase (nitroreductase family)